jgi:hypothetical protein
MSGGHIRDLFALLAQASDDDKLCQVMTKPETDPSGLERSEVICVRIAAVGRNVPLECYLAHKPESRIAARLAEEIRIERKRRTN